MVYNIKQCWTKRGENINSAGNLSKLSLETLVMLLGGGVFNMMMHRHRFRLVHFSLGQVLPIFLLHFIDCVKIWPSRGLLSVCCNMKKILCEMRNCVSHRKLCSLSVSYTDRLRWWLTVGLYKQEGSFLLSSMTGACNCDRGSQYGGSHLHLNKERQWLCQSPLSKLPYLINASSITFCPPLSDKLASSENVFFSFLFHHPKQRGNKEKMGGNSAELFECK